MGVDQSRLHPDFAVLLDHKLQSVVLAIRGTQSVKDVMIDLIGAEEEFMGGHAHKGILRYDRAL